MNVKLKHTHKDDDAPYDSSSTLHNDDNERPITTSKLSISEPIGI